MTTTITPPKAQIPIGVITINGVRYEVAQHPEFVRFFFDIMRRVGGSSAPSNTEIGGSVEVLQTAEMTMQPAYSAPMLGETVQPSGCNSSAPDVLQPSTFEASAPDVMQSGSMDVFGSETTWQPI